MGLRQQLPIKPAFEGPLSMISASSLFCYFVSFGGLPGGFFASNACTPLSRKSCSHKRTASTDTLSREAMCSLLSPSQKDRIASILFTNRVLPTCSTYFRRLFRAFCCVGYKDRRKLSKGYSSSSMDFSMLKYYASGQMCTLFFFPMFSQ